MDFAYSLVYLLRHPTPKHKESRQKNGNPIQSAFQERVLTNGARIFLYLIRLILQIINF